MIGGLSANLYTWQFQFFSFSAGGSSILGDSLLWLQNSNSNSNKYLISTVYLAQRSQQ